MRLVALAQVNGGNLPIAEARAIVAGVGPALPPPTLQGLEVPGSARPAGAPPAAAAPAPGYGAPAAPGYGAPMPGGPLPPGLGGPAPGGFPPLAPADLQRLQGTFVQLDGDRDGFVTGAECFGFFSQSGLDKAVLRDIWSLVAGTEGRLSGPQFVASMYLMEMAKRGVPLPKALPPGLVGFPPIAGMAAPAPGPAAAAAGAPAWSLQSQFGTSSNITKVLAAPPPSTNMAAPPPPLAMLPRADLGALAGAAAPAAPPVSHVPQVPAALMAGVTAMERTKLQEELQACEAKEKAQQTAEERAADARARQAQLTTALQELVVFRNRAEVALITSQDQARRLEDEVEASKKRYDSAYTAAQAASEKSAAVHAHLMELMTQKAELEEKMRRLEGEIAAAERMGPADVARLEAELADLTSRAAAMEAARNAKLSKVDGLRRQQEAARAQLAAVQESDAEAAAEVEGCQGALDSLETELQEARAAGSVAAVPGMLTRAANVYRGLYGIAQRAGTAVPYEALPATLTGLHVWADEVAAGVIEWADDADARGYITVNALPGADAPKPIIKAAPPAAAKPAAGAAPAAAAAGATAKAAPSAPAAAAAPTAPKMLPDDFAAGFGDAPAFNDPAPAFGSAGGSAPVLPPAVVAAVAAAAIPAFGSAPVTSASQAPPPPPPAATPADTGFGDDAFGSPSPAAPPPPAVTPAAAAPSPHGSLGGAGTPPGSAGGALGMPQSSVAASEAAAAPPPPPVPMPSQGSTSAGGSGFGVAFDDPPAFFATPDSSFAQSGSVSAPSVTAAAAAPPAPAASLNPVDSGALGENPFAAAEAPPAAAGASFGGASQSAAEAGFGSAASAFEDNAFGSSPAPAPPAEAPPTAPPPAPPAKAATAFGEENPFGDSAF
ncbi:hypothetical protein HYH03_005055 [Edaphochlamys debaryana]|uniref:Uncharacterized protein n=1 Tax=Edaphochlamys debaryana TaxID=47281 RepID=A0A835Y654_9CHLO|nr:hypothetical protein HYH03_005055 [Edaphochlamys debaryana]|eukprot:KAG2497057.1 hypothetical protein HYH03_005055 [Edaphochlamys debaryana]